MTYQFQSRSGENRQHGSMGYKTDKVSPSSGFLVPHWPKIAQYYPYFQEKYW